MLNYAARKHRRDTELPESIDSEQTIEPGSGGMGWQHEHLDVHITVTGVAILHDELQSRGALITKPLEERPWSCKDFYVEDLDGYILCFSEPTA